MPNPNSLPFDDYQTDLYIDDFDLDYDEWLYDLRQQQEKQDVSDCFVSEIQCEEFDWDVDLPEEDTIKMEN